MDSGREKGSRRSIWDVLFRRRPDPLNVTGYQDGDVEADRPVRIAASAVVAGNVKAPEVSVAGILHGFVVTRALTVAAGGQIWGDVVAVTADVKVGASVCGWLVTTNEEDVEERLAQELNGQTWPRQEQLEEALAQLPPALQEVAPLHEERAEQWPLLNHLRLEAGRALKTCAELQRTFDQKLQEAAGDALAQVDELEVALAEANETIDSLQEELATQRVSGEGRGAGEESQALARRVESLESALQASVEHNAEQEETLLRWQELAEATHDQIRRLEGRLEQVRAELVKGDEAAPERQPERGEPARSWEKMNAGSPGTSLSRGDGDPVAADSPTPEVPEGQSREWEAVLAQARLALQDRYDQILWYRASLSVTQERLRSTRVKMQQKEERLQTVRHELARQRLLANTWKARVERLSELLYESIRRVKENETRLNVLAAKLDETPVQVASAEDEGEPT